MLTAMEYNREDKKKKKSKVKKSITKKGKKTTTGLETASLGVAPIDDYCRKDSHGGMMVAIDGGEHEGNYPDVKIWQRCWIPQLKTLGNFY